MSSLIRGYWWLGASVIWIVVARQLEPFKSHFWLRELSIVAVAFAIGTIYRDSETLAPVR